MFCISLANQIHVIQRQPFFQVNLFTVNYRQPFYRLGANICKKIFEPNKNSANRQSRKGKNHFQVRQKIGIHNNEIILDRNIFLSERKYLN